MKSSFGGSELPASFATPGGDVSFVAAGSARHSAIAVRDALESWQVAKHDLDPAWRDAAEFAQLAYRRWAHYGRGLAVARTMSELRSIIRNNPKAEVPVLMLAKVPRGRVRLGIGAICLFRRTWYNNIYIIFWPSIRVPNSAAAVRRCCASSP